MLVKLDVKKDILQDKVENFLFCVIMLRGMGAPGTFAGVLSAGAASAWNALNTAAFLVLTILIAFKTKLKIKKVYGPIVLFGLYVFITGLMVSDFSYTVYDSAYRLILSMICAVYIGSTRDKNQTVKLLAYSQIAASLMVFFMIVTGYSGVAVADGYYKFNLIGLYTTKNSCGYELVFGMLVFYYCFRTEKNFCFKIFWLMATCGQFAMAILARTVGALATGLFVILLYEFLIRKRKTINLSYYYLGINGGFWIFVGLVLPATASILKRFGKSVTLTGRTDIWKSIVTFVGGIHQLFGYGYGGFWNNETYTGPLYALYRQAGMRAGLVGGHNLFMELYINVGIIGIILFIYMVHSIMKKSSKCSILQLGFEIIIVSFLAIRGLVERTLNPATYDMMALFLVFGTIIYTAKTDRDVDQ